MGDMNHASHPPFVPFTGVNHLAFITRDLPATIRFYRDLLGLPLIASMGDASTKHYFFRLTERDAIAFFAWDEASPIVEKRPGVPTSAPRGFDHLALGVASKDDLLALCERLEQAGVAVEGPVDHGLGWSIYFKDPNQLDLEITWDTVALDAPLLADPDPPAVAREGSAPRAEVWPSSPLPRKVRSAKPGAGRELGDYAVARGLGRWVDGRARGARP